jgi:hypothetical protein
MTDFEEVVKLTLALVVVAVGIYVVAHVTVWHF